VTRGRRLKARCATQQLRASAPGKGGRVAPALNESLRFFFIWGGRPWTGLAPEPHGSRADCRRVVASFSPTRSSPPECGPAQGGGDDPLSRHGARDGLVGQAWAVLVGGKNRGRGRDARRKRTAPRPRPGRRDKWIVGSRKILPAASKRFVAAGRSAPARRSTCRGGGRAQIRHRHHAGSCPLAARLGETPKTRRERGGTTFSLLLFLWGADLSELAQVRDGSNARGSGSRVPCAWAGPFGVHLGPTKPSRTVSPCLRHCGGATGRARASGGVSFFLRKRRQALLAHRTRPIVGKAIRARRPAGGLRGEGDESAYRPAVARANEGRRGSGSAPVSSAPERVGARLRPSGAVPD